MTAQLCELTPTECLRLLATGRVGRLAFPSPSGQQVIVVNYRLRGDTIICRTTPYSELGRHGRDTEAALEIDGLDPDRQTGWSVLAKGRLGVVSECAEVAAIKGEADPSPWTAGARCLYLRLTWRELTGRRIQNPVMTGPPQPRQRSTPQDLLGPGEPDMAGPRSTAVANSNREQMRTGDLRSERMDRVADRLADALEGSLSSLADLRRSQPLTEEDAIAGLTALLHKRGIQLNAGLLRTLVRAST